ncbi:hypothetical protein BOTBODRAFT_55615 [Botryobasidium botryosum FD-172 SS1]|uniref:SAM domain-containing protein n=1 Tax=Botryobasidium botryosum (strain FD-172 SS1) TaxID=930990 RepID=A0A067MHH4_BOTB1|nr:hypothetical protein BOTBODRAFT_55615 [Botryobasidium botryosum FD-172 SS1]
MAPKLLKYVAARLLSTRPGTRLELEAERVEDERRRSEDSVSSLSSWEPDTTPLSFDPASILPSQLVFNAEASGSNDEAPLWGTADPPLLTWDMESVATEGGLGAESSLASVMESTLAEGRPDPQATELSSTMVEPTVAAEGLLETQNAGLSSASVELGAAEGRLDALSTEPSGASVLISTSSEPVAAPIAPSVQQLEEPLPRTTSKRKRSVTPGEEGTKRQRRSRALSFSLALRQSSPTPTATRCHSLGPDTLSHRARAGSQSSTTEPMTTTAWSAGTPLLPVAPTPMPPMVITPPPSTSPSPAAPPSPNPVPSSLAPLSSLQASSPQGPAAEVAPDAAHAALLEDREARARRFPPFREEMLGSIRLLLRHSMVNADHYIYHFDDVWNDDWRTLVLFDDDELRQRGVVHDSARERILTLIRALEIQQGICP